MSKEQFNIILIICDTLSANHMSVYGYNRNTTPYFLKLLEQDDWILYKYCFSTSSWTLPAHASLFTGLYPSDHGVTGETFDSCILSDELVTLSQLLKLNKYTCLAVSSNPIISRVTKFNNGFDFFVCFNEEFRIPIKTFSPQSLFSRKFLAKKLLKSFLKKEDNYSFCPFYSLLYAFLFLDKNVTEFSYFYTRLSLQYMFSFIRQNKSPFFIFLNLMENHDKYIPPVRFRRKFLKYSNHDLKNQKWWKLFYENGFTREEIELYRSFYDEEVLTIDYVLVNSLSNLKNRFPYVYDNSLIIVSSDHGEALGEWNHWGHNFSVYPEVARVPLLIKFPKGCKDDRKKDSLIQINDLFATILTLIDQNFPVPESSISIVASDTRKEAIVENYWSKFNDSQHVIQKEHFFAKIIQKDDGMFEYTVEEKLKNKIRKYKTKDFIRLIPVQEDKKCLRSS